MKTYIKAIDLIQWIYKTKFDIDKSKSQIRKEIEQGAVRHNDQKIKIDDAFEFVKYEDDSDRECGGCIDD